MFCISAKTRLLNPVAITMLVAGLTAAQALTPAGEKRPANVPAHYLITPFGYFEPSCVSHLAQGDEVRKEEKAIRHANGTYDNINTCAFPHYKASGENVVGDEVATAKQPSIGHAWVEYASTTTSTSYAYMYAYWTVCPRLRPSTTARRCTCSPAWRTTAT